MEISNNSKNIHKKHYQIIPKETRLQLIDLIFIQRNTIKTASEICEIGFASAKMIVHVFRHQGRIEKKRKYEKFPKLFEDGIFNRTVISISPIKREFFKYWQYWQLLKFESKIRKLKQNLPIQIYSQQ